MLCLCVSIYIIIIIIIVSCSCLCVVSLCLFVVCLFIDGFVLPDWTSTGRAEANRCEGVAGLGGTFVKLIIFVLVAFNIKLLVFCI